MADSVFNRAKGRGSEWIERVNANDPANSVILVILLASSGLESHATLIDKDTISDVVSGTTDLATNTNGTRKSLDQTGGLTVTYDDTNDRADVDMPDPTWTALANDGTGAVGAIVTGYDSDSTAGTDANVLPWTLHDFAVTPSGADVTAVVPSGGFFRAS